MCARFLESLVERADSLCKLVTPNYAHDRTLRKREPATATEVHSDRRAGRKPAETLRWPVGVYQTCSYFLVLFSLHLHVFLHFIFRARAVFLSRERKVD